MGFPRQQYWSGLPFPFPRDLPDLGIESGSPALASGFFTTEPLGKTSWYFTSTTECQQNAEGVSQLHTWLPAGQALTTPNLQPFIKLLKALPTEGPWKTQLSPTFGSSSLLKYLTHVIFQISEDRHSFDTPGVNWDSMWLAVTGK